MTKATLDASQIEIFSFIHQHAPISTKATVQSFQTQGAISESQIIVSTKIESLEHTAQMLVSLPTLSNKVFITITDKATPIFAKVLAGLSAKSETSDAITYGFFEQIYDETFRKAKWEGILLTSIKVLIDGFPYTYTTKEEEAIEFILVLPINAYEILIAQRKGSKELINYLSSHPRNLFKFDQQPEETLRIKNNTPEIKAVSAPTPTESTPIIEKSKETKAKKPKKAEKTHYVEGKDQSLSFNAIFSSVEINPIEKAPSSITAYNRLKSHPDLLKDKLPESIKNNVPTNPIESINLTKKNNVFTDILPLEPKIAHTYNAAIPKHISHHKSTSSTQDSKQISQGRVRFQLIAETVVGSILLTGGIFASFILLQTKLAIASILGGLFGIAGLMLLGNALKNAVKNT